MMKKVVISASVLSLMASSIPAVAIPSAALQEELNGLTLGRHVSGIKMATNALDPNANPLEFHRVVKSQFVFVSEPEKKPMSAEDLENYFQQRSAEDKRARQIRKGKIVDPNDPWGNTKYYGKQTLKTVWEVGSPFLMAGLVRIAGDIVLSKAAPWLANEAGNKAAQVASVASNWWTKFDPTGYADNFVSGAARATAQGETYRDMGVIANYVEKHAYPVAASCYSAGTRVLNGAASLASATYQGARSFSSRLSNWWCGTQTEAAAA